jgi:hypothetical protein
MGGSGLHSALAWLRTDRFHSLRHNSRLIVDGCRFKAAAIAAALKPNSD